jgi:hypothetical protein
MGQREDLIVILETSRAQIMAQLARIDLKRQVYPLWTIREMLAHLAGWDDAVISFLRSLLLDQVPAKLSARGIDAYNAETVAKYAGVDYDQVYLEFLEKRKTLLDLLRQLPEGKLTTQYTLPWDEPGTLVDIVDIFGHHEQEHALDLQKLINEHQPPASV